jgi:hypothetical protein
MIQNHSNVFFVKKLAEIQAQANPGRQRKVPELHPQLVLWPRLRVQSHIRPQRLRTGTNFLQLIKF